MLLRFTLILQIGYVFEMEAVKRFLNGLPTLILCSLQFSESREVFEILQNTFERLIAENGEEHAASLLEMLSDSSNISSRDKALKSLIVVGNDGYEFSFAGMRKVLLANLQCYISLMYPLLHRHLFQSDDSKTKEKLKMRLWNKWKQ